MSRNSDIHRLPMLLTVVLALILDLIPLPDTVSMGRPNFLIMVVLYWSSMAPRVGGMLLAFVCGLLLDAFQGVVLGQHALATCLVAYLAIKMHLRIRIFSILQQAMTVFLLLVLYHFVLFWIDGATGHPISVYLRWLPALTSALLWPIFVGLLGHAFRRT